MEAERERFAAEELAVCLSHYDLGKIRSIQEFNRGSPESPKLVIESERGRFFFKRRARGKDDPARVAFTHQIQLTLGRQNFPVARLIGTKAENKSILMIESRIYEMFEFVEGGEYDDSPEATQDSGRTLALYHTLLQEFHTDFVPPTGSYHAAKAIRQALQSASTGLPAQAQPPADLVDRIIQDLDDAYARCTGETESLGMGDWPRQIVHGDWHPGNMLFRRGRIAAVVDYDSARIHHRALDLANGALQFSIIGGGGDPAQWPDQVDEERFRKFLAGYDSVNVISKREIQAIPSLMCEAMIAEAVLPIAATGHFGRMKGLPFLQMIDRKVRWVLAHLAQLQSAL